MTHDKRNKMLPPKLDPCLSAINWMLRVVDVAFDRKSAGKFVRITEMNDNVKLVCTSKRGPFNPLLEMI